MKGIQNKGDIVRSNRPQVDQSSLMTPFASLLVTRIHACIHARTDGQTHAVTPRCISSSLRSNEDGIPVLEPAAPSHLCPVKGMGSCKEYVNKMLKY